MRRMATAGVAAVLCLSVGQALAQDQGGGVGGGQGGGGGRGRGGGGRGNFNPEEMRARMMDRYKESLEIKSDDEWKVIQPRIEKVTEARRDVGFGGMGRGFGMMGRPGGGPGGPGGPGGGGGDNPGGRPARFGGEPNPDADALQKAIEGKASADEIKAKLTKYRESKKAKEAKLEAAQEDLRKTLTVRQEATLVLMGVLN
jgi:hypothetical protein